MVQNTKILTNTNTNKNTKQDKPDDTRQVNQISPTNLHKPKLQFTIIDIDAHIITVVLKFKLKYMKYIKYLIPEVIVDIDSILFYFVL